MNTAKVINPVTITDAMLISSTVPENDYTAFSATTDYALGDKALYATTHKNYELITSPAKTVTVTIASPAVVTSTGHGLVADTPVRFSTTGALPTGITAGTVYYVKSPTTNTYQLSATAGGAAINTSGTQSGTHTATARPLPTNESYWLDLGATNRWAAFDNVVGTATSQAGSVSFVLEPGGISGAAFLELVGTELSVSMKDESGGTVIYSQTIDLDGSIIDDIFDWFFAEYEQRTDVVLTDLPSQYTACELTATVTATSGNAEIGVFKLGSVVELGRTLAGAKVGIIDFSRKETDTFGNTVVTERSYSKRASFDVLTTKADFNKIFRRLAGLRATPAVYIGAEESGYEPMIIYGFFKDFSIDVAYPTHHLCSIEIEGIV